MIYGLFFWSLQRSGNLALARTMAIQGLVLAHLVYLASISQLRCGLMALPRKGWQALGHPPAALWAIAGTVLVQALFSQTQVMNSFFSTAPLDRARLLVCAFPMLLMLPVAWIGERMDPTTGKSVPPSLRHP